VKLIRKGLVAKRDLKSGEYINLEMIEAKRPAIGIEPYDMEKIMGLKLTKDVKTDEPITWNHFK
jgi:sialic acid synthase SpsE